MTSEMPSAIITGASGFLGRQVLKVFSDSDWQATGTGFSRASGDVRKVDIQDGDALAALFDEVKYESFQLSSK
jgi:nucleoside-diphosphate-sugar epimerase